MLECQRERRTHDYVRHTMISLSAALEIGRSMSLVTLPGVLAALEFRKFLDNYTTHKPPPSTTVRQGPPALICT
jgi:hypothetical protein